jgi:hypothetical protein
MSSSASAAHRTEKRLVRLVDGAKRRKLRDRDDKKKWLRSVQFESLEEDP